MACDSAWPGLADCNQVSREAVESSILESFPSRLFNKQNYQSFFHPPGDGKHNKIKAMASK